MKNGIFGRGLAVAMVVLFVGSCVVPSTSVNIEKKSSKPTADGNILYVGGSGPGNYSKIQDAIDNASYGDTVFVHNDSSPYYEHIYIGKSINLIGEDRNTTVIDGNNYGTVVCVSSKVMISGFTIQNSGNHYYPSPIADAGIYLYTPSSCTTIVDNNIWNNLCGVLLYCSGNNDISGNLISLNEYGIYLPPSLGFCNDNIFSGNVIRDNERGICMSTPENNYIFHNNFINNTRYNAWDVFTDFWDDGSVGNYWDNYIGLDLNHDGIGDRPHLIPPYGLGNKDRYPLMGPWPDAYSNQNSNQNNRNNPQSIPQSNPQSNPSQNQQQISQQMNQLLRNIIYNLILRHQMANR